eukprot:1990123-Pyramimonas_sp.AAC.1
MGGLSANTVELQWVAPHWHRNDEEFCGAEPAALVRPFRSVGGGGLTVEVRDGGGGNCKG